MFHELRSYIEVQVVQTQPLFSGSLCDLFVPL